jgi:Flp pilus assembly protein TadD
MEACLRILYDSPMPAVSLEKAIELADQLMSRGQPAEAERVYRQILATAPQNIFVLNRLGICVGQSARLAEARDIFRLALQIDPKFVDAWANLSLACERLEELDGAIAARRKAIELHENNADHWHRLGTCLGKKGELSLAIESLRKSIELDPNVNAVHHDLVLALSRDGQQEAAEEAAFLRFEVIRKVEAEMIRPVADNFKSAGNFQRATDIWRRVVEIDPSCFEAHGQLAMCLITLGDYENGWRLYESRWQCDSFKNNSRRDPARQWGREPVGRPDVAGKTILIYCEQGIGDTIQFVRYATLFAERGARVIVECHWPVKSLLERCAGVRLVYGTHEALPNYDWHIPVMSLPHVFETRAETIPAEVPYISVDPSRRKSWAGRVEAATPAGTRLRVGIAWAGSPKHKNDANRSIHPELLAPLADVDGVVFFSLQKANENEKAAMQPVRPRLVDFTSSLCDFGETAALMDHLDLVICADTAVAHLAGATGKPVWTLLPFVPDFRWGLQGSQTPWYPTMRLFRQPKPRDWASVMEMVVEALKARADEVTQGENTQRFPAI